ncbi:MAG TPA: polysaccharide deacetylase family protein [Ktedonobacterales bacterium]|nr:polysaccharide deacetylase family protein [Ktedonobacterales bacterium]
MRTVATRPGKVGQAINLRASQRYRTRQRIFVAVCAVFLTALAVVCLAQFGLISFIWSSVGSTLPMMTVQGAVEDGQTGQALAHVSIAARIFSFATQTTTDAQGRFSMRVPNSSQLNVSVPGYDAEPITPAPTLTIKLAPDPSETARRFMNAFMQQNVAQLWSMLHPDEQAFWRSEAAFASFLARKFGPFQRLSFNVGQANTFTPWINPDTTQVYDTAAVLPVSLTLGVPRGILSAPSEQAVTKGLFNQLTFAEVKSNGLWRVLVGGPLDQEAPIVIPAKAPAVTAKVPILMYHHVSAKPTMNSLDFGLTVTTPDFAAQMDYLAKNGYHPIKLIDIFDNLYYGTALPKQPIVISFDDGYEDNYTDAFPILVQHHFVAEINIITGMIGHSYLTWNQIRQMAADGIEIGSHTIHHISLASALPQTAEQELSESKATLQQQLNMPIQFFCYPSGEPFHNGTVERQQFITSLLALYGYVGALLDPGAESVIQNPQQPYQLPRIRVAGGEALSLFINKLDIQGVGPVDNGPGA